MAQRSKQDSGEPVNAEELVEQLEKLIERTKVMYEQYFMGIQKLAPSQLHNEIERRLRDLQLVQIRNTAVRYRHISLQQKFASYNNYWRRSLREIEQGRYLRNLAKIGRDAARTGAAVPEEVLAAMPKRMREQVVRDREKALAMANRRGEAPMNEADALEEFSSDRTVATPPPPDRRDTRGAFLLDEDEDLDLDSLFSGMIADDPQTVATPAPKFPPPAAAAKPAGSAASPSSQSTPSMPPPTPTRPPPVPRAPATASGTGSAPRPSRPMAAGQTGQADQAGQAAQADQEWASAPPTIAEPRPRALSPSVRPPAFASGAAATPPERAAAPAASAPARPAPRPATAVARPANQTPGMTEAEVRELYASYVKAKKAVGEQSDATTYAKLIRTIQQQAPKIMAQYKSAGVEFGVVVKDNQVILKAKPKK